MSERIPAMHTGNCPVSYFLLVLMTPSLDLELKTRSQAELPKKKKKRMREGGDGVEGRARERRKEGGTAKCFSVCQDRSLGTQCSCQGNSDLKTTFPSEVAAET